MHVLLDPRQIICEEEDVLQRQLYWRAGLELAKTHSSVIFAAPADLDAPTLVRSDDVDAAHSQKLLFSISIPPGS